jgi:predicted membrane protein
VDSVVIELHEELLGQISYEIGPTELAPGQNIVHARSGVRSFLLDPLHSRPEDFSADLLMRQTSVQGVFSLSSTSVRLGKASFHYSLAEVVDVRVRRDPLGVRAALRMPYDSE